MGNSNPTAFQRRESSVFLPESEFSLSCSIDFTTMLSLNSLCESFTLFRKNGRFNNSRINENGRFNKPKDGAAKAAWEKYDNDLFQTGRLITCGLYVNCVLKDYVRTILSLNRTGTTWDLDPRTEEGRTLFNTPAAEGTGNQVSAEFNLSEYRVSRDWSLLTKMQSTDGIQPFPREMKGGPRMSTRDFFLEKTQKMSL
jgi:hypothetical protein